MVEPLFPITSTGNEVWLVLCELCISHPSVDVYAHLCWKWMSTYMVWPLRIAEWMEGLWPLPFSVYVCYSGCKPWWLNHCFPPHLQERRCGGFMWDVSFTSQRGCVLYDAHLCWKWMLTFMDWPLRIAEWMEGLWSVPLYAYVCYSGCRPW
jgi:hypothetical protein